MCHFLDLVLEREYEVWVGRKVRRDLEVCGGGKIIIYCTIIFLIKNILNENFDVFCKWCVLAPQLKA